MLIMRGLITILFSFVFLLSSVPADAKFKIIGIETGFYVTLSGYIVTNAHVVAKCQDIYAIDHSEGKIWSYKQFNNNKLELINIDHYQDLVVLRDPKKRYGHDIPDFLKDYNPEKGEKVYVIGFPGESGSSGKYKFKESVITNVKGPTGEAHQISFEHAGMPGNSGGPLLDAWGNIIGVVSAKKYKNVIYRETGDLEGKHVSDVAVNLDTLIEFLNNNRVFVRSTTTSRSRSKYNKESPSEIKAQTAKYITRIFCTRDK